jgi:hypothetical protein
VPKRRDYKLDIKTNATGLIENFGIKAGLSSYIENVQPKWATVVEVGETYAVWVRNVNRTMIDNTVNMSFDLIISKPTALTFKANDILTQRHITVPPFDLTVDPQGGDETIRQKLESYAKTANLSKTGARVFGGITLLTRGTPLSAMLVFLGRFLPSQDNVQRQKVEGIIVGGIIYANLQEIVVELEK